jgi:hypothetical protein
MCVAGGDVAAARAAAVAATAWLQTWVLFIVLLLLLRVVLLLTCVLLVVMLLLLQNPLVWSTGVALLASAAGSSWLLDPASPLAIPQLRFIDKTLAWFASCTAPVTLFTTGLWMESNPLTGTSAVHPVAAAAAGGGGGGDCGAGAGSSGSGSSRGLVGFVQQQQQQQQEGVLQQVSGGAAEGRGRRQVVSDVLSYVCGPPCLAAC